MVRWVAEWTRAGDGDAVVVGSNPVRSMDFFFLLLKNFYIFWWASCQYLKHKISSTVTGTVATAYYNLTRKLTVTAWMIC